jgi:hypothetical protein
MKGDAWKWIRLALEIAAIVAVVWLLVWFLQGMGIAEDGYESDAWVICKPGDLVNVRACPSNKSTSIGLFECGYVFRTDWEVKNGWIHAINLSLEETEGWIYSGYVSAWEPEWKAGEKMTISAEGRVACRRWCDGPRIDGRAGWIKPGATVQVFYYTNDWCVTNRGYIRTEFLEAEAQ